MSVAALVVTVGVAAPQSASAADGIVARLHHLPGVTYLGENPYAPAGYRVFELEIAQPVDHHHPNGPTFEQQIEVYHHDIAAPTVMFVPGYFKYTYLDPRFTYLSDPAAIVGGNQITIEHRFFGDSVPQPPRWSTLTIWQNAADEHHVREVFASLYSARWLITGISKGGETAVFHDYYYPHDFAGTFAWSAPSITSSYGDAYDKFLAKVGSASCRAALLRAQTTALQYRGALERRVAAAAAAAGETFDYWPDGLDEAFEQTVLFTPFVFWQYGGDCATIPAPDASVQQLYDWYDGVAGWLGVDDQESAPFFAYNYQAGTQLGFPLVHEQAQLGGLLHYPVHAQYPEISMPPDIPRRPLDQTLMRTIHRWVEAHGHRLLFLYGQRDPFSAQRFELGAGSADCYIDVIPRGAHTDSYTLLPAVQRAQFVRALQRWAGEAPTGVATFSSRGTPRAGRPG